MPLLIRNDTDLSEEVAVHFTLPAGWSQKPDSTLYMVAPHDFYSLRVNL